MTGYNKVFLDTAPLIYFLDEDSNYGEKARLILEEIISGNKTILSSVITCTEYLVHPYRTRNQEKIDVFFEFVEDCDIFLTNDKQLRQFKEMQCITVDEWELSEDNASQ